MLNLETKLEQLIQPVVSCNYQADLSVWISEILASPQDIMVIVDGEQIPQGLVTKIDILGLIAGSLPTDPERNSNLREPESLHNIIQPLACLSQTTTVKQFLSHFNKKLMDNNYAVVDRQGKLLGLVNISKLLQNYSAINTICDRTSDQLVSEIVANSSVQEQWQSRHKQKNYSSPQQANINNQTDNLQINNDGGFIDQEIRFLLYSLLNRVVLPLQIKSNDGEVYYTNPAWQQEFGSQFSQASSETKISSKFWTILDNQNLSQPKESNHSLNNIEKYQCAQSHNFLLSPFLGSDAPLQKSLFPSWSQLNLNHSAQNSLFDNHGQRQESIPSSKKWIYHELPFAIQQNSLYLDKQAKYRLILATQANLFPEEHHNNNSFSQIQSKLQQLQHQFFLSIGHDLKSPLTSIIGLSSLLNEERIGELNDNQMRYSQMIYHSGKKLITLINDFLSINRFTNQQLSIKAEEIALEDLIQSVYKQINGKLQAIAETSQNSKVSPSCLDLTVSAAAQTILADRICLHQILTRLLETSFPSYPDAQCIKIAAELWSEKWLAISIWGQSTTTSSTQQAFFCQELQSDRNNFLTSEENKQFLGLCLAQQLAKFHGGDISFITQHNHSNHFTLVLPQASSSLNPSQDDQENNIQNHIKKNNNLVVAFSSDTARILDWQQNFQKLGYHLLIARSSDDLIYKAVCFQPYSIVFDGSCLTSETSDLIEKLGSNLTTQKIPLVYIDSCAENLQSLNRSFLANIKQNCNHTVSIPITPTKLQQIFPAIKKRKVTPPRKNLTVMRLAVGEENHSRENCVLDSVFENPSFCLCHHIIEADNLEQAYLLARIWKIDAIIWDGQMLENPQNHLESLANNALLADIPIVTLDKKNTAIANQIENLAVFPCLLPAHERSIEKLTQVIQIAAGLH